MTDNNYLRKIKPGVEVDVYDVLAAFHVTNPATAHAIKKLLCAGQRGHKSLRQDLLEAKVAIERAIDLDFELEKILDDFEGI
jgi:hypothetical protein